MNSEKARKREEKKKSLNKNKSSIVKETEPKQKG